MSDFNFLYELYDKSGNCVMTQSVTGKRLTSMLEHISRIVTEQERTHGKGVTVHILKSRTNENVLVDPKRMESLSALVTMGVEHCSSKFGNVVVENVYEKSLDETLVEVLSNPKKAKKLIEAAKKLKAKKACMEDEAADDDDTTLKLPDLNVGDTLLVGKFKNRRAEIKGFSKDENNQPVASTTKGDQKIFKPRIAKIMPGAEEKKDDAPIDEAMRRGVNKGIPLCAVCKKNKGTITTVIKNSAGKVKPMITCTSCANKKIT